MRLGYSYVIANDMDINPVSLSWGMKCQVQVILRFLAEFGIVIVITQSD